MKKTLIAIAILFATSFSLGVASIAPVSAVGTVSDGSASAKGSQQPDNLFGDTGVFSQISSLLLFIVGAISVIMIIIGGLRYVISGGNTTQIQAAKNTILYALVGIVVAILAYAAVNFVINSFSTPNPADNSTPSYGASTK